MPVIDYNEIDKQNVRLNEAIHKQFELKYTDLHGIIVGGVKMESVTPDEAIIKITLVGTIDSDLALALLEHSERGTLGEYKRI